MKNTFFLIFFILLISLGNGNLNAQTRYLDKVFDEIDTATYSYFAGPDSSLFLDIYFPKEDLASRRPLLLYVHGGGFRGGTKNNKRIHNFCSYMAKRGIIVATMEYNLWMKGGSFNCEYPGSEKRQVFLKTGRDISRAVNFIIDKSREWGIDTTKIVISGSSAGAEAVLHAAYWDETRQDDDTTILSGDFSYAGVISMAGAIIDLNLITTRNVIPTQLFHGTCDPLVPYGTAAHHYCPMETPGSLMLFGPYPIMNKINEMGGGYYLFTECGGGHEWASKPTVELNHLITDFIFHDVINGERRQIHLIEKKNKGECVKWGEYNFCK